MKNIKHYFRKVDYILKGGCPVYIKSPKGYTYVGLYQSEEEVFWPRAHITYNEPLNLTLVLPASKEEEQIIALGYY